MKRLEHKRRPHQGPLAPAAVDHAIAIAAGVLLLALATAVMRGQAGWRLPPVPVWVHLGTVAFALLLTATLMVRRRGDRWHRILGWTWAVTMIATALVSLQIRFNTPGQLSPIHLLSAFTLLLVPSIVVAARRRRVVLHRTLVRLTVILALLVAGALTFGFQRLLGRWLFG